jgi:hypothetical protein
LTLEEIANNVNVKNMEELKMQFKAADADNDGKLNEN